MLVVLLALLRPISLLVIWSITCTICCPLIAAVIPGYLYYRKLKSGYEESSLEKLPLIYALVQLIMMPLLLMLTIYSISTYCWTRRNVNNIQIIQ